MCIRDRGVGEVKLAEAKERLGEDAADMVLDRDLAASAPVSARASERRWLAHAYLGLATQRLGNYAAAERLLREAEEGLRPVAGAGRSRLETLALLVANLTLQRKDVATEPVARRLVEETATLLGEDHPDRVRAANRPATSRPSIGCGTTTRYRSARFTPPACW